MKQTYEKLKHAANAAIYAAAKAARDEGKASAEGWKKLALASDAVIEGDIR